MYGYRFSGPKLRSLRKERDLSREQIAVAVPCSQPLVVKWELDYSAPPRDTLLRLMKILDCRFEDLVEPDPDLAVLKAAR